MKAKESNLIIYDDSCPMCKAYTKAFVSMGVLTADSRVGFADTDDHLREQIDLNRGRHEIPLLDQESGEVRYGLRALTHLLAQKWPRLRPILKSELTYFAFYPLYQIITYNRRLIANSRSPQEGFDCAPDFNAFYRALYILLAMSSSLLIMWNIAGLVAATGGVLIGLASLFILSRRSGLARWDAFGHLATVAMISALLTLPLLVFGGLPLWGTLIWSGLALGVGLRSWLRRMR